MQVTGIFTPRTLAKAQTPVQRLRWLLYRIAKSKLSTGLSRESIHKICLHYWNTVGESKCKAARARVLAQEGSRASADHTYHVVSNLAARDDNGRLTALKASLTSVMGQDYVLGCKVQFVVPATMTASLLPTIIISVRHHMTSVYILLTCLCMDNA